MKILVTGGGGFLGGAIVQRLVAEGHTVRSVARGSYPALDAQGCETIQGSIDDPATVARAVQGCDSIFHVAAKAGVWGKWEDYVQPNVVGTRTLLAEAQRQGVRRFVYTSTPSVVHAGHDIAGLDESAPYATSFQTHYPHTKALAEQEVLAANSPALSTVALRPHLIWGPGDNHLVPRIVQRARAGRLRFVGDGSNRIDATYIDNAAQAHLDAWERLAPDAACAGRAYFIANDEPIATRDLINGIVQAAGLPPVTRTIPAGVAYVVGALMEATWSLLGRADEPMMTRFVAQQLSTEHFYNLAAARRDLGYAPRVTTAEGLARLAAHLRDFPIA